MCHGERRGLTVMRHGGPSAWSHGESRRRHCETQSVSWTWSGDQLPTSVSRPDDQSATSTVSRSELSEQPGDHLSWTRVPHWRWRGALAAVLPMSMLQKRQCHWPLPGMRYPLPH